LTSYGMGLHSSVNVNTVDWSAAGLELKNITNPKNMQYCCGLDNSFKMQDGQPWEKGFW